MINIFSDFFNRKTILPASIISLILLFSASPASAEEVRGRWVNHPVLDINSYLTPDVAEATNNVQRLIETDRYVYALINGNYYKHPEWWCDESPMNIARYDKTDPKGMMTPLSKLMPLSGNKVVAAEYNRSAECMVVAYDNRAVDFIFSDGSLVSNSDLTDALRPGGCSIRSISFSLDGTKTVLATDFGILVVDTRSGNATSLIDLNTPVDYANIIGNRFVIAADSKLRVFPTDAIPDKISDLPVLTSADDLCNPLLLSADGEVILNYGILPVNNDSFIFFGGNTSSTSEGVSVNVLSIPSNPAEDQCRVTTLMGSGVLFNQMGLGENLNRIPREAALAGLTDKGLSVNTHERVYLIDTAKLPDALSASTPINPAAFVKSIEKDKSPASDVIAGREAYKLCSTYDGTNFLVFRPRQGFQRRRVDTSAGSATWTDTGEIIAVNAPCAGMASHLFYNPKYGVLAHNCGRNTDNVTFKPGLTDGLSAYSAGEWKNLSLSSTKPENYFIGKDAILLNPTGGGFDPLAPDYFYAVSRVHGMRRQNLADPDDVIHFTRSNHATNFKGHVTIANQQTGSYYPTLCSFAIPDFDNNGTMWTSFTRLKSNEFPDLQAELWYWPAEDRLAVKTPADYAAHPFRKIVIPGFEGSQFPIVIAGRQPVNENLIAVISGHSSNKTFFYDHNGTPEDTSDDRIAYLENAFDQNGEKKIAFTHPSRGIEDPYDGAFIVDTVDGLIYTSRADLFNGENVKFNWLRPTNCVGGLYHDFGRGGIAGITVDNAQRKWITLSTGSLVCLSPDRTHLLAEFTPQNSGLPSSTLYGVTYNPASNSIFVATDRGIAEFVIDGAGNPLLAEKPDASPKVVEPHFKGYINFTGLIDSNSYSLINSEGKEIKLPASTDGKLQIDPSSLLPGIYTLSGHPDLEIYIVE